MKYLLLLTTLLAIETNRNEHHSYITNDISRESIIHTNSFVFTTNYFNGPFAEFKNISNLTNKLWIGDIDFNHPTNVECIFYCEPIVVKSNNIWIVHFKERVR